jgi:hypothetical protein
MDPTDSRSETWRGAVVAASLILLTLGVFLLFAYGRQWKLPAPKAPPPAKVEISMPKASKHADDQIASPAASVSGAGASAAAAAGSGSGGDDGRGDGRAGGGGSGGGGSGASGSVAPSAGDALRQALQAYRSDPSSTATVQVSAQGRFSSTRGGTLTAYDGLPAQAVNKGLMITSSGRATN